MISIYKNSDKLSEIIFRCTPSEKLDTTKIKGIIKTIKRIDKNNLDPCQIVIKEIDNVKFTKTGEEFYKRLKRRSILDSSRISLFFED